MPRSILSLVALAALAAPALAQTPTVQMSGVTIRKMVDIPTNDGPFSPRLDRHPIRIAQDPTDGALYVLSTSQPDGRDVPATSVVYRLDVNANGTFSPVPVLRDEDHATPRPVGMAFGPEGNLYLVGNDEVGTSQTQIVVRRGMPSGDRWTWATVATSEPYLLSYTYFDHRANSVVVSPDGSTLVVNAGSRTDHGESYGGVRDEALNAVLLKIPATATNLLLPNDREVLRARGLVYAEGNRNTADLAYAPNGDLFGPDNAGDRDDPEELNWLREGRHYGFPWRIGGNDTPMWTDPAYNPNADPLVPSACSGTEAQSPADTDTGCYFGADPAFPDPPAGLVFTEPIPNAGPYADEFLDPRTGSVRDASSEGITIPTFSGGRSMLGITFDADSLLTGRLKGGAFVLSFAGARGGFPQGGRDLIFLDLNKGADGYTLSAEAVAANFSFPIDTVTKNGKLYVVEYGRWFAGQPIADSRAVWEVTLPTQTVSTQPDVSRAYIEAYPNPTSGPLTLAYSIPEATDVRVEMVDALGRIVRTLERPSGEGRVEVSTDGLGAGIYVVRVTAGTVRTSQTITILR